MTPTSMIISLTHPLVDGCERLIGIDEGPFLQHIAHKNYIITTIIS